VLVFYGEGGRRKAVRRIRAIAASKGLTPEETAELDIVVCRRAPQLGDQQHLHQMRNAVAQYKPVLIILDPLYLSVGGDADGSNLYKMGGLLAKIQSMAQSAGATLLVSHHWNKTGRGDGHGRSSGVGPGAWGRFLISIGVVGEATDPETTQTTVTTKWSFKGDEIPTTVAAFTRRVRAEDPTDLRSPLRYTVEPGSTATDEDDGPQLTATQNRVLQQLRTARKPLSVKLIGDGLAQDAMGRPLRVRTIQTACADLLRLNLVARHQQGTFGRANDQAWWLAVPPSNGGVTT